MHEEQRRAQEARQAKADVTDTLSADGRAEISRIRADIAWMRFELAMLALRRKVARLDTLQAKARHPSGHDANQPRVPAGNPEGGQWTTEGGQWSPETLRLAQNEINRHIRNNHVSKTDEELTNRIVQSQHRTLFGRIGMDRNGSFVSEEAARQLIRETLDKNPGVVDDVAHGRIQDAFVTSEFGRETGREAYLETPDSPMQIRKTYGAGVYIVHDPFSERGYRIVSAYPRNYNPRMGR